MNKVIATLCILLPALLVSGCAPSQSGSAYSRSQARQVQDVEMGVVESVRQAQPRQQLATWQAQV